MSRDETPVSNVESQKDKKQEEAVPFFAHLLSTQVGNPEQTLKFPSDWEDN